MSATLRHPRAYLAEEEAARDAEKNSSGTRLTPALSKGVAQSVNIYGSVGGASTRLGDQSHLFKRQLASQEFIELSRPSLHQPQGPVERFNDAAARSLAGCAVPWG